MLARFASCAPPMPPDPAPRSAKPPSASLAPRRCARKEAGDGNRTRDPELGRLALYHLSYSRASCPSSSSVVEWRGEDSNLRRHSPADLQSAPFGHSGTSPSSSEVVFWSRWSESNRRPADYKSAALPLSYIGRPHRRRHAPAFQTFPRNLLSRFRAVQSRVGSGGEHTPSVSDRKRVLLSPPTMAVKKRAGSKLRYAVCRRPTSS